MAKTFTASFAQDPQTATAVVTGSVGSLDSDSPTNTEELLQAGSEGAIVTRLTAMPRGTVTDSGLVLFVSDDGGTTKRLIDSALMEAHTVEDTSAIPKTEFDFSEEEPLRLGPNDRLYVGSMVSLGDGIVFTAEFTDY